MRITPRRPRSFGIETLENRTLLSGTETASATIVATKESSGDYQYAITLTDTASAPATASNQIGTFWYAWVPGTDYLKTAPLSVSSPAGWTDQIVHAGSGDGYSVQWVASGSAIQAGASLSGFSFTSTDTPATVFSSSSSLYGTATSNIAFVYAGAPETDAGFSFSPTSSIASTTPTTPTTPTTTTPTADETASAAIVALQLSDGSEQYSITLKNTTPGPFATDKQIGTFWYAWLPTEDFLTTSPLSISSPKGWTAKITNTGSSDGYAIQWVTSSNFLKPGKSLSGFVFTSADTPVQVFGNSVFFPSEPVDTSVVYSGAPFSDTGFTLEAAPSISNKTGALLPELPVSTLTNATTVPANGDENPYGVAFVPKGFAGGGSLSAGDVLVSNFNNSDNLQGTGSTIVSIDPAGQTSLFYQSPTPVGLTTALGVLRSGFVLVGNVPSTDGTAATVGQGSLIVLDKSGNQVANFTDPSLLDGPWDLAVVDGGTTAKVFVSNVLSGTVTRLNLKVSAAADTVTLVSSTQIASGFTHEANAAAFELGPTGLVYDAARGELFVASTGDNAIYAIPGALSRKTDDGTGKLVYQDAAHLRGPLGLVVAPNGDLITSNGDAINANPAQPSELVEFTPTGKFVTQTPVDSSGEGGAFGIAISAPLGNTVQFAAVDDLTNSLDIWTIKRKLL